MKKFLGKLLMFMMVFSMMFSAEVAMQQITVNAEPTYDDYVWSVERGGGMNKLDILLLW